MVQPRAHRTANASVPSLDRVRVLDGVLFFSDVVLHPLLTSRCCFLLLLLAAAACRRILAMFLLCAPARRAVLRAAEATPVSAATAAVELRCCCYGCTAHRFLSLPVSHLFEERATCLV